jgi:hypothetical protein
LWTEDSEIFAEYKKETEFWILEDGEKKNKEKKRREDLKKLKLKMKEQISSKLSKEELKFIKFK